MNSPHRKKRINLYLREDLIEGMRDMGVSISPVVDSYLEELVYGGDDRSKVIAEIDKTHRKLLALEEKKDFIIQRKKEEEELLRNEKEQERRYKELITDLARRAKDDPTQDIYWREFYIKDFISEVKEKTGRSVTQEDLIKDIEERQKRRNPPKS